MPPDVWPVIRAEHHPRYRPSLNVLLVFDVLVAGQKEVVNRSLSTLDQLAVRDLPPAFFISGPYDLLGVGGGVPERCGQAGRGTSTWCFAA